MRELEEKMATTSVEYGTYWAGKEELTEKQKLLFRSYIDSSFFISRARRNVHSKSTEEAYNAVKVLSGKVKFLLRYKEEMRITDSQFFSALSDFNDDNFVMYVTKIWQTNQDLDPKDLI